MSKLLWNIGSVIVWIGILFLGLLLNYQIAVWRMPKPVEYNLSRNEIIAFTNKDRRLNNQSKLTENIKLTEAAIAKARALSDCNCFQHNLPDGTTPWVFIHTSGYNYEAAGENLAIGFRTSYDAEEAWMNSPGHKANILNKEFTEIGVGIVGPIVVQIFGKPAPPPPKRIRAQLASVQLVNLTPEKGKASWYDYSLKGFPDYSKTNLTAASTYYPRGTKVEVCSSDKCVIVRINDYGPAKAVHPDRVIDLSSAAFKELAPLSKGVLEVTTRKVDT